MQNPSRSLFLLPFVRCLAARKSFISHPAKGVKPFQKISWASSRISSCRSFKTRRASLAGGTRLACFRASRRLLAHQNSSRVPFLKAFASACRSSQGLRLFRRWIARARTFAFEKPLNSFIFVFPFVTV